MIFFMPATGSIWIMQDSKYMEFIYLTLKYLISSKFILLQSSSHPSIAYHNFLGPYIPTYKRTYKHACRTQQRK